MNCRGVNQGKISNRRLMVFGNTIRSGFRTNHWGTGFSMQQYPQIWIPSQTQFCECENFLIKIDSSIQTLTIMLLTNKVSLLYLFTLNQGRFKNPSK